jgi:hypothetical protein
MRLGDPQFQQQQVGPACEPAPRASGARTRSRRPHSGRGARPSVDHQHGRLHGVGAEPVQGLLTGLNDGRRNRPSLLTKRIAPGTIGKKLVRRNQMNGPVES